MPLAVAVEPDLDAPSEQPFEDGMVEYPYPDDVTTVAAGSAVETGAVIATPDGMGVALHPAGAGQKLTVRVALARVGTYVRAYLVRPVLRARERRPRAARRTSRRSPPGSSDDPDGEPPPLTREVSPWDDGLRGTT